MKPTSFEAGQGAAGYLAEADDVGVHQRAVVHNLPLHLLVDLQHSAVSQLSWSAFRSAFIFKGLQYPEIWIRQDRCALSMFVAWFCVPRSLNSSDILTIDPLKQGQKICATQAKPP